MGEQAEVGGWNLGRQDWFAMKIDDLVAMDLWTMKDVSIEEILDRVEERTDEDCEKAMNFLVDLIDKPEMQGILKYLPVSILLWGPSTKEIMKQLTIPDMPMLGEIVILHVEYLVREYKKEMKHGT